MSANGMNCFCCFSINVQCFKKDDLQEQNGNAKPAVHNLQEHLPELK